MIDDLGSAMRNWELSINDKHTVAELRTFTRNDRGTMSGSPYDDRVMALALANQMRKYAYEPEYAPQVDDYWTIDWFARLGNDQKEADPLQIGLNSVRGTL